MFLYKEQVIVIIAVCALLPANAFGINLFGSAKKETGGEKGDTPAEDEGSREESHPHHTPRPPLLPPLPALPALPALPPFPELPFLPHDHFNRTGRPTIVATKTVYVEVTSKIRQHPICIEVHGVKPPCLPLHEHGYGNGNGLGFGGQGYGGQGFIGQGFVGQGFGGQGFVGQGFGGQGFVGQGFNGQGFGGQGLGGQGIGGQGLGGQGFGGQGLGGQGFGGQGAGFAGFGFGVNGGVLKEGEPALTREGGQEIEGEKYQIKPTASVEMLEPTRILGGVSESMYIPSSEEEFESGEERKARYLKIHEATPSAPFKSESEINESPEALEGNKERTFDAMFNRHTDYHYATKTLWVTKVEKYLDHRVTATLIAHNCIPNDLHFPLCHHYAHKPVHHEPAVQPVLEPVHHKPVHHEPVHHKPVHHEPVHHKPVHHEPVHHKPVHHEPIHHQPIHHETIVHKPVHHPHEFPRPVHHEYQHIPGHEIAWKEEHNATQLENLSKP